MIILLVKTQFHPSYTDEKNSESSAIRNILKAQKHSMKMTSIYSRIHERGILILHFAILQPTSMSRQTENCLSEPLSTVCPTRWYCIYEVKEENIRLILQANYNDEYECGNITEEKYRGEENMSILMKSISKLNLTRISTLLSSFHLIVLINNASYRQTVPPKNAGGNKNNRVEEVIGF